MKLTPLQPSFSAGEISPLMWGRSDTDGYKNGLATLENMFADSRGPAVSRFGLHFITNNSGDDGRVLAFPVNVNFFYTILFLKFSLVVGSIDGHVQEW